MLLYNSLSCCGTNNICRLLPHCTAFRTDVLPHPVHDQPCCWIVPALIAVFLSCREINGSDQRKMRSVFALSCPGATENTALLSTFHVSTVAWRQHLSVIEPSRLAPSRCDLATPVTSLRDRS